MYLLDPVQEIQQKHLVQLVSDFETEITATTMAVEGTYIETRAPTAVAAAILGDRKCAGLSRFLRTHRIANPF